MAAINLVSFILVGLQAPHRCPSQAWIKRTRSLEAHGADVRRPLHKTTK